MTKVKELEKLKEIAEDKSNALKARVAQEVVDKIDDYGDDKLEAIKSYFTDLFRGGCASGFVSSLISYYDTHKFYDQFYEEIEDLVSDYEQDAGERINTKDSGDDRKNFFAWFAFEETAYRIANEIGVEI